VPKRNGDGVTLPKASNNIGAGRERPPVTRASGRPLNLIVMRQTALLLQMETVDATDTGTGAFGKISSRAGPNLPAAVPNLTACVI
jgi:hypothetical protein